MNRKIKLLLYSLLLLSLCFILVPGAAWSQDDSNALDYLPSSQQISGWEPLGNEELMHGSSIEWLFPEEYPLMMEFDLAWYASETYSNFQNEMTIEIFEFPTTSDAFGFYALSHIKYADIDPVTGITVKPYGSPPPSVIDTIRTIDSSYLEGYKDRFYFRLRIDDDTVDSTLIQVAVKLQGNLPNYPVQADMIGLLPRRDLVNGTERYVRGAYGLDLLLDWDGYDIFGYNEYDWKAVCGEYRLGSGEYFLLLIARYDDSDTAAIAADRLQDRFSEKSWNTLIVPPLENGVHPRGFIDDTIAAFWNDGDKLWLCWDLTNQNALNAAMRQIEAIR
jgi:hypothetical protein